MIQPYSMADDLRGEAMAEVGSGGDFMPQVSPGLTPRRQLRLPFTVTMPFTSIDYITCPVDRVTAGWF